MAHQFRVREIAAQAGLSEATVDRVLHQRGGVRASTVDEVQQAIADLGRQRSQLRLAGRTFMVDVVVQAPPRFSVSVRAALEAELPSLRPAVIRSRFHLHQGTSGPSLAADLRRIARTGSHGVILKAPDLPDVVDAVARLAEAGIPVVTLVTDLPATSRAAYVGIDNRAAGATAAYLLSQWLGERAGDILVVRGRGSFRGEDEREMGFRGTLRDSWPRRAQIDVVDEEDQADAVGVSVRTALAAHPGIRAVYSMYAGAGGNTAVLDAFGALGRRCDAFIAHDLDGENAPLLQQRRLTAVLQHDLRHDLRRACQVIMQAQHALPGPIAALPSTVQIITPHNVPPALFPPD
ncbi:MAG TPA: LacI family DNA-binding transcriptional regulator [Streptosporangiaceae bacterium]|nr:LacI family DNA-binding transcriptional regulator [Streptosporangiaceae bacterium]